MEFSLLLSVFANLAIICVMHSKWIKIRRFEKRDLKQEKL